MTGEEIGRKTKDTWITRNPFEWDYAENSPVYGDSWCYRCAISNVVSKIHFR